jgi:hypothetical protein
MKNPFRGDIPALTAPPRPQWEADYGRPCVKLDQAGAPHIEHARRIVSRDLIGLTKEEALEAQTQMDELCERVLAKSDLDWDAYVCFFDPDDDTFWAYPA